MRPSSPGGRAPGYRPGPVQRGETLKAGQGAAFSISKTHGRGSTIRVVASLKQPRAAAGISWEGIDIAARMSGAKEKPVHRPMWRQRGNARRWLFSRLATGSS